MNACLEEVGEVDMLRDGRVSISCVLPSGLPAVREEVRKLLGPACRYSIGGETTEDIEALCLARRAMLWAIRIDDRLRAMVVTDELSYHNGKALRIRLGGGDGAKIWLAPFAEAIRAWSMEIDAIHVEILGRPGWVRLIRQLCGRRPDRVSAHMVFEG